MYDSNGNVKPTRLSALLNAALGYVADQTQGFIDFDAVPEEGATIQVGPASCICNVFVLQQGVPRRGFVRAGLWIRIVFCRSQAGILLTQTIIMSWVVNDMPLNIRLLIALLFTLMSAC